jgi:hypothetical protein
MSLLLIAALSSAPASEGHHGFGIYDVNPDLTTGDLEYFREIFVSPDAFPTQVDPLESAGDGFGVLEIENKTTASNVVHINGVKVGIVGPLTTAKIHRMKVGTYTVTQEAPNGFTYDKTVSTVEAEGAAFDPAEGTMKPDPAVTPAVMPVVEKPEMVPLEDDSAPE